MKQVNNYLSQERRLGPPYPEQSEYNQYKYIRIPTYQDQLKFMTEKLAFDFQGHHFDGDKVAIALGVVAGLAAITGLRRYFAGGWCSIEKNLTGEVAVITGGNTGIGKETARRLGNLGCDIIFGARDVEKNESAVKELLKTSKGKVVSFKLDLADKLSIQKFAKDVEKELKGKPINYLINNAGIMAIPVRKMTKDGFEMQFGVNHYGHFYLTYLLWSNLKAAGNPRIINLSSIAHETKRQEDNIDFNDMNFVNGYIPWSAYSRSKKANILFTAQLQRRMDAARLDGISVSLHPGVVRTELLRQSVNTLPKKLLFWTIGSPFYYLIFKNSQQGAQTSIYSVLERADKLKKGAYYADCEVSTLRAKQCADPQAAKDLWEASEKALGIRFNI